MAVATNVGSLLAIRFQCSLSASGAQPFLLQEADSCLFDPVPVSTSCGFEKYGVPLSRARSSWNPSCAWLTRITLLVVEKPT